MGWDFSINSEPKARKDYACGAAEWILSAYSIDDDEFTSDEKRILKQAELDGWKIKKGTHYLKTEGVFEGEWSVFRARPDLNQICLDHDIYQDC
jgi:hypothetical protein